MADKQKDAEMLGDLLIAPGTPPDIADLLGGDEIASLLNSVTRGRDFHALPDSIN